MGAPGVPAPARLGRYELLARLASGGMGEIFLARLPGAAGFEKLLVIKRILPHLADDARFRAMLITEARIAARMAHANICQVYELGETEGQLYIVMEHLEGLGLLPLLRKASRARAPLELGFIGGVVQQCCDALHYAHELRGRDDELLGVVHRDVTPGNIFLTGSGVAKLLDFGIAKGKDVSTDTQAGTVKGKHAYMAPEQLRGGAIDRRADVFALGVVIYEMLALRRLFQRKTDYLTFRALMEQPIPDVRRYRPDAPAALAELLPRVLDRDPERRPATARLLAASVLEAIGGRPWSQSDLGDFLRTSFADELNRRRAGTAKAAEWSVGAPGSTEVPALDFDAASDELDDDDAFPPVDTAVADAPPEEPGARESGGPPAPSLAAPAGARAAPASTDASSIVVVHRRGLLWPLLALAMIGIAGAALFLLWKRMQRQGPETIIVTESRSDLAPPATAPDGGQGGSAPAAPDPAGSAGPTPPRARPATPPRPSDPYNAVISAHRPQMSKCMTDNPLQSGSARMNAKVKVIVQPSGKPKAVSFEPGALGDTAAGACIKSTLSAASFPSSKAELTVTFPIWL